MVAPLEAHLINALRTKRDRYLMAWTSMGIVINQDGEKFVLSGSNDYRATLWNLSTRKIVWAQKYGYDARVAVSGNGRRGVISADADPVLMDFDF